MQLVLDTQFNTIEQLVEDVDHFDLEFRLFDTGGFSGQLKQFVSRDILFSYARLHRALHQAGSTPSGYKTFVIPGRNCRGFWWRGHRVTRDDLLVFPSSNELRGATLADFEVFTICVHLNYFEQVAHDLGIDKHAEEIPEVIPLDSVSASVLRRCAENIVRSTSTPQDLELAHELAQGLVIQASKDQPARREASRIRDLAVDRVINHISSVCVPTNDLAGLCRIALVSERTLQYAFIEHYGIPPNVFVKRWRLNSARHRLLQAEPENTTIKDIALELGFSHLSQFSTDYRKLFLESPSMTLKKPHSK